MGPEVYQLTAGPTSHSDAEAMLEHSIALLAPGDGGRWSPERYGDDFAIAGFLKRFAEEMKVGDILLMRVGRAAVAAVGVVASEYAYLEQFDDVSGLDLQHTRRVRWARLPEPYTFSSPVFGAGPTRTSRVTNAEARDFAERFVASPPTHWQSAPLSPLPARQPPLADVPGDLRGIVALVADLVPIYGAASFGGGPSEHELVAQLVVPFLRALGWRPEHIGVEWRSVDVVTFRELPRRPESCHLVIEAKRLGAGVEGAFDQALGYTTRLGIDCDIVVTDGVRYRMYSAANDYAPLAYANLARLKRPAGALFAAMRRP